MGKKLIIILGIVFPLIVNAQYRESEHNNLPDGVIAVSGPGSYGNPGSTYMLTNDITSDRSTRFLEKM